MRSGLEVGALEEVRVGRLDAAWQRGLVGRLEAALEAAPYYRPTTPRGPMSALQTNFGRLGWVADVGGYRYAERHPETGASWPAIPDELLKIWRAAAPGAPDPDACLVNRYEPTARMGMHRDLDETDRTHPVVTVSLGAEADFLLGGLRRQDPVHRIRLASGDVTALRGVSRLAYHGVSKPVPGDAGVLPAGVRVSLTLRRAA